MRVCLGLLAAAFVAAPSSASAWGPPNSPAAKSGIALVAVKNNDKKRFLSRDVSLNGSIPSKLSETSSSVKQGVSSIVKNESVHKVVTITLATALTYALNNLCSLGPICASSITALLSAMILSEKLALAATCGSFAGMAKVAVVPTLGFSALLGGTCSAMMALFDRQKWLLGVGGRLGFIAQCACTFQFIVASFFINSSSSAALVGTYPSIGKLLRPLPSVAFFTVAGAFFMSLWKQAMAEQMKKPKKYSDVETQVYQRLSGSCAAVGATGLLASLFLPAAAAGPAFCGSFITMSSPAKLPTYGALLGASIMGAVCQQSLAGVLLGGWGGKLGTAALMGVLSYNLLAKGMDRVATKPVAKETPAAQKETSAPVPQSQ